MVSFLQLAQFLAAGGHDLEQTDRGEQPVPGVGSISEDDVTGLLATQ